MLNLTINQENANEDQSDIYLTPTRLATKYPILEGSGATDKMRFFFF